MTTFNTAGPGSLDVRRTGDEKILVTINTGRGEGYSAALDPADAPAIALAVLKAAGHASQVFDATAVQCAVGNLERHMDDVAAAAEEAARDKRRDELAREFANVIYDGLGHIRKLLIDRIIDTENELAKERAK